MVTAVLPAYLVLGLHLSFAQYGVLDGIYTGATALTRLVGGSGRSLPAAQGRRRGRVRAVGAGQARAAASVGSPGGARRGARRRPHRQGDADGPRDALMASAVDAARPRSGVRAAPGHGQRSAPSSVRWSSVSALLAGSAGRRAVRRRVRREPLGAALIGLLVLVLVRTEPGRGDEIAVPVVRARRHAAARSAARRSAGCAGRGLLGLVTIGDGFVFLALQDPGRPCRWWPSRCWRSAPA